MRRAVNTALNARPFSALAEEMIEELLQTAALLKHPFFSPPQINKTLLLLITPNRGLCGGLNANLFKALNVSKNNPLDVVTIGKKGEGMARKLELKIIAAFGTISDMPKWTEVLPAVKLIREEYEKNNYDKVMILYSEFLSALSQKPKLRQILPLNADQFLTSHEIETGKNTKPAAPSLASVLFEPNREAVLFTLLPRIVEARIYQSVLEASASEHSARMLAMRNASEAGEEMMNDLLFTYNQARQAGITQQIAEVAGAAAAMSV